MSVRVEFHSTLITTYTIFHYTNGNSQLSTKCLLSPDYGCYAMHGYWICTHEQFFILEHSQPVNPFYIKVHLAGRERWLIHTSFLYHFSAWVVSLMWWISRYDRDWQPFWQKKVSETRIYNWTHSFSNKYNN